MKIAVGIPTINRADLLNEALTDFAKTFPDMDKLYIVDNGNQNISPPVEFADKTVFHKPSENLGVAASWNKLAEMSFKDGMDYILIVNDDIISGFNREMIEAVIKDSDYAYFINPGTWSVFLMSKECLQVIGPFDQIFFPAYFEDNDYSRRLTRFPRAGTVYKRDGRLTPRLHRKSMSILKDRKLNANFGTNATKYIAKWGGLPGHETFADPYNDVPPTKLFIITRTSKRPNFFKCAYESIHGQAIPNSVHVVLCDDIENSQYVLGYRGIKLITLNRELYWDKPAHGGTPYNEYLNHALNLMRPDDYFVILDDDDFYINNTALKTIWEEKGESDVIIWRVQAAGGIVPFSNYFASKQVIRANIAMPGFMVKRSTVGTIKFTSAGGGDFNFMDQVIKAAKSPKWLDQVIASVSPLMRQGRGQQKDAVSYEAAKTAITKQ